MPGRMVGRVALVTGGGGGIGEATGRLFAEEGGAVALLDTDRAAVEEAAAGIRAAVPGARAAPLVGEVTREAEALRLVDETVSRLGDLHTLVNVAGVRVYAPLAQARAADWERIIGVNVLGTAHSCKAAVLGFTRALAVEEAPHRIRVHAICPGGTITPYHIRRAAARGVSESELRGQRSQDNLLGRWAEPREVAFPILFLASDESSFVTGATLMVDAGRSIS